MIEQITADYVGSSWEGDGLVNGKRYLMTLSLENHTGWIEICDPISVSAGMLEKAKPDVYRATYKDIFVFLRSWNNITMLNKTRSSH